MDISKLPAITATYANADTIATQITSLNALNRAVIELSKTHSNHPYIQDAVATYINIRGAEVLTYCRIVNRVKFNHAITNWV